MVRSHSWACAANKRDTKHWQGTLIFNMVYGGQIMRVKKTHTYAPTPLQKNTFCCEAFKKHDAKQCAANTHHAEHNNGRTQALHMAWTRLLLLWFVTRVSTIYVIVVD